MATAPPGSAGGLISPPQPPAEPDDEAPTPESVSGAAGAAAPPRPAHHHVTFRQAFGHRYFRRVLIAQFVSNVGTWMEMFTIQMFVAQTTGRLDDQGILGALQSLPIFLLGIFGGLAADRFNRRTLLVVTQILASVVAAGVALVAAWDFESKRTAVHWLFALGALNGCVMAFNFPAWQTLTPRLVPRAELSRAIALNGIQFNMARVLGPALAGLLLATVAAWPLLAFNALSFLIVAGVVASTPNAPAPARDGTSVWQQVVAAWRFLRHQRGPRAVFLAQVYISLLAAPLVRLLSMFVIDVYGLEPRAAEPAAGTLLAVQGIGAVIGGVALGYIPPWYPRHHFIPVAVSALGLAISLFAATTTLWMGYGAMLICGFFWIWAFNQSWAALQVLAPDHMRGRVLSLVTVAGFGATALGVLIAGLVGEVIKRQGLLSPAGATQAVIGGFGIPLLLGGVYMLMNRTPEVDGPERVPAPRKASGKLVDAVLAREHWPE
ncbi:MAG: MFS transporter [Phycisphaeraceae bacterium]|nr:MFS transporter [Phycisphaeraceae bacterium]